jgi:hypothetical protein
VWHTTLELEVPDNHPHINGNDLDDLLEASGGDVQMHFARQFRELCQPQTQPRRFVAKHADIQWS